MHAISVEETAMHHIVSYTIKRSVRLFICLFFPPFR